MTPFPSNFGRTPASEMAAELSVIATSPAKRLAMPAGTSDGSDDIQPDTKM
jgi:hypothetical protein